MAQSRNETRKILSPQIGAIVDFMDGEEKGRQVPLIYTRTVLGRKYGDILIRDIKASATHVAIEVRRDGFWLFDLESSNGTFVKGVKIKQMKIEAGEEVRIGFTRLRIILNPELAAKLALKRPTKLVLREGGLTEIIQKEFFANVTESPFRKEVKSTRIAFEITSGRMKGKRLVHKVGESFVLGRLKADMVFEDPDVSRKHALIEFQDSGQIILRDLGSRNGTFVNGQKITNAVIKRGDKIQIGTTVAIFMTESD